MNLCKTCGTICPFDDERTECDAYAPMTNENWFISLPTEEKAMIIVLCCPYEADWFGENFEKRMKQRMKNLSQSAQGYELGVQKIKEWLKQPHTNKE